MNRLEFNIERLHVLSDTLSTLHYADEDTQALVVKLSTESIKSILQEEKVEIPYALYSDASLSLEGKGLKAHLVAGVKGTVRTAWKVAKAIWNAMVLATTTLTTLLVKLQDRVITLFSGRSRLMAELARWYGMPADKKLLMGSIKDAMTYVNNLAFVSHGSVMAFLTRVVKDDRDIGADRKSIVYYMRSSNTEGSWKVKYRGWNVGTYSANNFEDAIKNNPAILEIIDKDMGHLLNFLTEIETMEKTHTRNVTKLSEKHKRSTSTNDIQEVVNYKESIMADIKEEMAVIVKKNANFELGKLNSQGTDSYTFDMEETSSKVYQAHMRHDHPKIMLTNVQQLFTKVEKKHKQIGKKLNIRSKKKWKSSKVANSPSIIRHIAEMARNVMAYFNKTLKVMGKILKELSSIYLSVIDSIAKCGTRYRQKERDLLTVKSMRVMRSAMKLH